MGAAFKVDMMPEEVFVADAFKDGRASRQDVSLRAVGTPDRSLQARAVHLNLDHCRRLERIAVDKGDLDPIVLFRQAKKGVAKAARDEFFLGDGHHRHHVYVGLKRPSIPAIVIDSTNAHREALEFACMCNRLMGLGRTPEDITRACELLLLDPVWVKRSDSWIGDWIGCSRDKVARIRAKLIASGQAIVPDHVDTQGGRAVPYRRSGAVDPAVDRRISNRASGDRHGKRSKASVCGKEIFASDESNLREKLRLIDESKESRKTSLDYDNVYKRLATYGFQSVFAGGGYSGFMGLKAIRRRGIVCVPCDFTEGDMALLRSISSLVAAQLQTGEAAFRRIVICYLEDNHYQREAVDLFRKGGFEFMTRDELFEIAKAD
jgi:hypothetical protein